MITEKIETSAVDDALANDDVFNLCFDDFAELRASIIEKYISETINNCVPYREFYNRKQRCVGYYPPPVPTSIFKTEQILSISEINIEKWSVSSGTLGLRSNIGRDRISLDRLLSSMRMALGFLDNWPEDDVTVIHLGPSFEDANDIWLPYVMSLTELIYPTESFGSGDHLNVAAAVDRYEELLATGQKVAIIGPPFAVDRFCLRYDHQQRDLLAENNVIVVTAGGWKDQIPRHANRQEFCTWIVETLGLSSPSRVRDAFSQVELNTILVECEEHRFHLPPWMFVTARSPQTLKPLPCGEIGLLSYIDASAASWPCIIIGDDVGLIDPSRCKCGRTGETLQIIRRIERGIGGGCATTLANRFGTPS